MNPLKQLLGALGVGSDGDSANELPGSFVNPELLKPISTQQPCGANLEYDPAYLVLQARLQPKADVQYGEFKSKPEPPDWAEIERDCQHLLLHKSKDINILVWLTRARTHMAGARGLLEGLSALQAVLETFAEQVHPQIVLDGQKEPAVRANALAALCDPEGLLGDVRDVVIASGTAFRLTVRDVDLAFSVSRPPHAVQVDSVKRQLADLHAKKDEALLSLLACGVRMQNIDQWCKTGPGNTLGEHAPSLGPLLKLLEAMTLFMDPAQTNPLPPGKMVASPALWSDEQAQAQDALAYVVKLMSTTAYTASGTAHQREQIGLLLSQTRQWIERNEPSSPVIVLLKQAQRMWGKPFPEVAPMIPPDLLQAWDRGDT
jgi:type VI secretion system protein ImpA